MFESFKQLLIGKPLKSEDIHHEKFSVFRGLPILSSDAISSVAYACEEILWVLIPVIGILAFKYTFFVSLAIIILLCILIFSYRQTIDSYPKGGGSYIVSKDNLGTMPSLVAGASLTIDYILTVAVSSCAGTAALTSAFPQLLTHKVSITIIIIIIMSIGNLRGISESGKLFSLPTYLFVVMAVLMVIYGIAKVYVFGYTPNPTVAIPTAVGSISIFIFLKAFSAGCTALTGIEAVSDGVPNFKAPAQKNAKNVLWLLFGIVIVIFGGMAYLSTLYHAVPSFDKTVISQIAEQVFGRGILFYIMQIATTFILIMAANTAFSDLPLLLSFIAKDGYAPRQFLKRGDRLSFSNGIIVLAISASLLVILFKAETHFLLPLYAIGVFMSFTLSQTGMVIRWTKSKEKGWQYKAFVNGFGAFITFITTLIIGYNKFIHGAWIVLILVPAIVYIMKRIRHHYDDIAEQLSMQDMNMPKINSKCARHFIVPVGGLNKSVLKTLNYAKCLSNDIIAFHVSVDAEETEKLKQKWEKYNINVPLVIREAPYRNILEKLMEYIESEDFPGEATDMVTIVIPQFIVSAWWGNVLHNHTALFLKNTLLKNRTIAVITVPYIIEHTEI
jgi:amino acid transporter